jgi:hypothetical protein
MTTVTVTRIASFLNLTKSRIAQLVMPKETHGRQPVHRVVHSVSPEPVPPDLVITTQVHTNVSVD